MTTATRARGAAGRAGRSANSCRAIEASAWYGIGAPKNTPVEIIEKLNREINAGLALPRMKARIADMGATVLSGSPADFGKLIAEETEKWAKVVSFRAPRRSDGEWHTEFMGRR